MSSKGKIQKQDVKENQNKQGIVEDSGSQASKPVGTLSVKRAIVCVLVVGVVVWAMTMAFFLTSFKQVEQTQETQAAAQEQSAANVAEQDVRLTTLENHTHTWQPVYEMKHTDEVNHIVYHAAEYGIQTKNETICNVCKEIITDEVAEHKASTGHNNYTTDVPQQYRVETKAAWDEVVVDTPAKDELVITEYKCEGCNEVKGA